MRSRRARLRCSSILLAVSAARVAAAQTDHDIHFTAEHVPESGMDAHYASLPWPAAHLAEGEWRPSVDLSTASTRTDFIDLDGPMVAVAATRGTGHERGYEVLGFFSEMEISGPGGRSVLAPDFLRDVPLDLPNAADFTEPRGTLQHFGVGAAYVRERGRKRPSQLIVGVLLETADIAGFAMDYRLAEGADAGASGVLDHSSRASYLTPFVGWQQTRALSPRWTWSPRVSLTHPLPNGDLDGRLTGSGFDLGTPEDGSPLEFGDPFVTFGLALGHVPSGFEIDLGATALFAAAEHVSHDGVDRALVVHVAWRPGTRAAQ